MTTPSARPGPAPAADPGPRPDSRPDSRPETLAEALAAGPVVLDGGLATELERAGHDLSGHLWSAGLLRAAPHAVLAAHLAFFAAGARVATTASYQASADGLATLGLGRAETDALLRRSVDLARQATEGVPGRWVAASVGPFGAALAGGEEYTGTYADPRRPGAMDVAALAAWHRPRLRALADAGPDVLACETVPAAAEATALLEELTRVEVPAWLSLTTVTGPDGEVRTRLGEPAGPVFALAGQVPGVVAVGVNCTGPGGATAAVRLAAAASGKPVVVYPNSGETWDAAARRWTGTPGLDVAAAAEWVAAGARLVGGCCRVAPAAIGALATALDGDPGA